MPTSEHVSSDTCDQCTNASEAATAAEEQGEDARRNPAGHAWPVKLRAKLLEEGLRSSMSGLPTFCTVEGPELDAKQAGWQSASLEELSGRGLVSSKAQQANLATGRELRAQNAEEPLDALPDQRHDHDIPHLAGRHHDCPGPWLSSLQLLNANNSKAPGAKAFRQPEDMSKSGSAFEAVGAVALQRAEPQFLSSLGPLKLEADAHNGDELVRETEGCSRQISGLEGYKCHALEVLTQVEPGSSAQSNAVLEKPEEEPEQDANGFAVKVRYCEKSAWQLGRLSLDMQSKRLHFLPAGTAQPRYGRNVS